VIEDLRSRAGFLGSPETVDAMFRAIESGVGKGWDAVYGGD
jgi:hypothetical protein